MNLKQLCEFPRLINDRVALRHELEVNAVSDARAAEIRKAIEEKTQAIDRIADSIYSIPPSKGRYALMSRCFWGMTWEEIAKSWGDGVSPGAFRQAAARAVQQINRSSFAKNNQCQTGVHRRSDAGGESRVE